MIAIIYIKCAPIVFFFSLHSRAFPLSISTLTSIISFVAEFSIVDRQLDTETNSWNKAPSKHMLEEAIMLSWMSKLTLKKIGELCAAIVKAQLFCNPLKT